MRKLLKKRIVFPIVGVLAFILSLVWVFVSMPNTYAAVTAHLSDSLEFDSYYSNQDKAITANPTSGSSGKWTWSTSSGSALASGTMKDLNNPSQSVTALNVSLKSNETLTFTFNNNKTLKIPQARTFANCKPSVISTTAYLDGNQCSSAGPTPSTPPYTIVLQQDVVTNDYWWNTASNANTLQITFKNISGSNVSFSLSRIFIFEEASQKASITAGNGVKSVYLSTNQNAASGSASGTEFNSGSTVYGFAELAKGYKAKSGWTLVSGTADTEGAKYRIGEKTVGSSDVDFGTIGADLISYTIGYTLNGGSVSGNPTSYYVTSNTITLKNPTKTGYTFKGWTGSNGTTPQTSVSIAKGSIGNKSYIANWTANQYTVTLDKQEGTGGTSSVTATYASAMPTITVPTRTGYTFGGYYTEKNGSGTQYYNADGTSTKNWDKASATTLYAKWTLLPVIQDVVDKINNISTVQYPDSKGLINIARNAYDALDSSYKGVVSNYQTLTTAESTYQTLRAKAINDLKSLIDSIGTVKYPDSKALIEACEAAYSHMDDADKGEITNYATLTAAREAYNSLKSIAVQQVIDAINDIGEVKYPESKEKIVYAEGLYNALDEDEKNTTVITNYETLTGSRATFDDLRANAIKDVMDKIDAITTPLVYPNSNSSINTARTAFDALHADDKNAMAVTNYQDLLDSEAAYYVANEVNEIGNSEDTKEFRDKVSAVRNDYNNLTSNQKAIFPDKENDMLNDYEAAIRVMDLINAIGDVEVTAESKALIDTANEAYEALTDTQKQLVANYDELISDNTDYDEALAVVNKIDAIGDGEYSEEKQALITDARESFNALTEYQQSIVYNSRLLYDKEVEATKTLIDNIGSVQYTPISKSLIDIASASYNALDSNLKQEVTNYHVLMKANNDYNKVDTCVNKVNSLGDLTYSETSNENIKNARGLIDALNADQKAILPEESENTLINYEKAYAAIEKIHSIGKIKYSTGTEELVKDAREAYDELSPEQKELINNEDFSLLTAKEEKLEDTRTTAIAWGVILILLALTAIGAGIFFIFFLLFKKDNDDDDKSLKNQNVVKASSSALPLIILTSHFFTGPYKAFYILLAIAAIVWIGVAVIYILKKKGIIKTMSLKGVIKTISQKFKKDSSEEDDDNTKTE